MGIKSFFTRIVGKGDNTEIKNVIKNINFSRNLLWLIHWSIIIFAAAIIYWVLSALLQLAGVATPVAKIIAGIFSIANLVAAIAYTVYKAIITIEPNWVWLLEIFGSYAATLKSGLHLIYPHFGITYTRAVYLGEQMLRLFMDESESGTGDVEFKDGSAPVNATVYYKIYDEASAPNAVYNIENLKKGLQEKLDSCIRSFLGQYTIDETNILKARANLINILNGEYIDPENKKEREKGYYEKEKVKTRKNLEDKLREVSMWNDLLENWGVEITGIAISDIELPEKIKAARQQVLISAKDAKSSGYDKTALENRGQGYAAQVKFLNAEGVDPTQSVAYLADRLKWENVGDKTVIIDSGGGVSGLGAQIGAGFKSALAPQEKTSKSVAAEQSAENERKEVPNG